MTSSPTAAITTWRHWSALVRSVVRDSQAHGSTTSLSAVMALAAVWERAKAVIGQEWAALCAWDFAEAEHLFELYRSLWQRWRAGKEIAGFSLQSVFYSSERHR